MVLYVVSGIAVFAFSGVMAMAGLGAAFLFVPMFLAFGVSLPQATSTALLLNVVSLLFAATAYARSGLVDWRIGVPILVAAVALAPIGARLTAEVDKNLLLGLFAGFLVFAGAMMLRRRRPGGSRRLGPAVQIGAGVSIGGVAGFLGGLLGVGGGNFVLPVLNWFGLDAKVAAGTTALVVVFSSLSGFLGHASVGGLDPALLAVGAVTAAGGSLLGSYLVRKHVPSTVLKPIMGILLWVIALKMLWDLVF